MLRVINLFVCFNCAMLDLHFQLERGFFHPFRNAAMRRAAPRLGQCNAAGGNRQLTIPMATANRFACRSFAILFSLHGIEKTAFTGLVYSCTAAGRDKE